jgi:predicted aspartyl protease
MYGQTLWEYASRIEGIAFMYVTVGISARPDSETRKVRLQVDSGAFFSMVPRGILEELGIAPAYREKLRVADGRSVERDVGYAFLHYSGRPPGPTIVVFAEPDDTLVLGVHTLEGLGLQVDPRSGTISAMDAIPFYSLAEA